MVDTAKLFGPPPKRILALDGGGIMGILSLCYLEQIETALRESCPKTQEFRLSDYFDLIGGTSTGAIIAAGLALGRSVSEIKALYRDLSGKVFRRRRCRIPGFWPKFPAKDLLSELDQQFGDTTLGSDRIKTGLAIFTKRFDTGRPWIVHNNPRGKFFNAPEGADHIGNASIRLSHLVRASAAAPFYFAPQEIDLGAGQKGVFVDGAVSPYNNPSLALFLVATLKAYGFEWETGEDKLQLVSVGTATRRSKLNLRHAKRMYAISVAVRSLETVLNDTGAFSEVILQALGKPLLHWPIDSELEDMASEQLTSEALFTYLRYTIRMEADWLRDQLRHTIDDRHAARLYSLDNLAGVDELFEIGQKAAKAFVRPEHFEQKFIPSH